MLFLNLISLNFSRLFHCSVFNVLCVLVAVSNFYKISYLSVIVNNFFIFFPPNCLSFARWSFIITRYFRGVNHISTHFPKYVSSIIFPLLSELCVQLPLFVFLLLMLYCVYCVFDIIDTNQADSFYFM